MSAWSALTRLDYPRFVLRVIVDSPEDAAWDRVERWAASHPELPIAIDFLRNPFPTCTLYCSAIHQAVRGLDESIEAIVFANADTMPHPGWLRSLAAPLADERIGAVHRESVVRACGGENGVPGPVRAERLDGRGHVLPRPDLGRIAVREADRFRQPRVPRGTAELIVRRSSNPPWAGARV